MRGRAVGYIRVGKRDEDAYQHLASRQIDLIADWAAAHEADVFDWFFDIGVEASEPLDTRSGGRQLLDRVGRGGLDFVIVASLDAIGRGQSLLDALRLVMFAEREMGVVAALAAPRASSRSTEGAEQRQSSRPDHRVSKAA